MKNKKLLNLYLLALSLLCLVTFILPFGKIQSESVYSLGVTIVYYITNILLVIALVCIVFLSIMHMFHDEYEGVKISLALTFVAFLMVFVNIMLYAGGMFRALSWGYVLLSVEVFALFAFNQGVKTVISFMHSKEYLAKLFPKKEKKETTKKQLTDDIEAAKEQTIAKPDNKKPNKPVVIKSNKSAKKEDVSDTQVPVSDNKLADGENKTENK